jgi:CheY-like chemotaxis protein
MDPARTERLCKALAEKAQAAFGKIDVVVSPAVGAIIPGYETARHLGARAMFVEREKGEFQLRRGFEIKPGERVLMVEDNPVNMMIAVAMLERWGVQVSQAENGRDAVTEVHVAAAAGHPFDAVLMDVQMPVMSGHEATRALRASPAGRELPIIALTAAALVTERDEALAAGMNDFLTKPIDAEKLRLSLLRWARRR